MIRDKLKHREKMVFKLVKREASKLRIKRAIRAYEKETPDAE
jgi:hypothetical protein